MTISTTVHSMGRYQGKMVPGLTSRDTPFRWISATHCPHPGGAGGGRREVGSIPNVAFVHAT